MVVIRLARHGSIHKPFYHVTVADRRARRDGAFIERVGFYNPIAKGKSERLRIDLARLDYWVDQGAQTSQTVSRLVKEARRAEQISLKEDAAQSEEPVKSAETESPESADVTASDSPAESSPTEAKAEGDTSEAPAAEVEAEGAKTVESVEAATQVEEAQSAESDTDATDSEDEKPAT